MYRCEDYPCCGCGPEGCINFEETVTCQRCGKEYHPDQNTEVFCYGCLDLGCRDDDGYEASYEEMERAGEW